MQHGQQLDGDFDAIVRVEAPDLVREPGQAWSFSLQAGSADERNLVHISLSETDNRHVINTDMEINEGWYRYHDVPLEGDTASRLLRMTRVNDHVATFYWQDCRWQPLGEFKDAFGMPVYLRLVAGNDWEATAPAAFDVHFRLEQLLAGEAVGSGEWQPDECGSAPPAAPEPEATPAPTAVATQSTTGHAMNDDFSAKTHAWCVASDDIAVSGFDDGAYFMHALKPKYRTLCFLPVNFYPTTAEFDAWLPAGDRGGTFGLMCNYQSMQDFYSIEFDLDGRSLYLRQQDGKDLVALTDPEWIDLPHLKPARDDANHFKIVCELDRIAVYVNGELDAELPLDLPAVPGDMALFVKGWEEIGPEGYTVKFDNFSAWRPEE